MIGQTDDIAPADRKLYALRDVTATVESIPLISASIMSKKLAEDLNGLVLDVKIGSGAFLPDPERALELARTMIALGEARGCRTVALLTAMDRPLGIACGNALEVVEAIGGLRGDGPADLMEVTFALGTEMLLLAGVEDDAAAARRRLESTIRSGHALERFIAMVEAQGGDGAAVQDPAKLPTAPVRLDVLASRAGVVTLVEPRALGRIIIDLGGGRRTVTDTVDPAVGLEVPVKPGTAVRSGERLATIHARSGGAAAAAARAIESAIVIGDVAPDTLPLIPWRVTAGGTASYRGG
jgi:pyrimidine-nucleoside phosphorylase